MDALAGRSWAHIRHASAIFPVIDIRQQVKVANGNIEDENIVKNVVVRWILGEPLEDRSCEVQAPCHFNLMHCTLSQLRSILATVPTLYVIVLAWSLQPGTE
jgi:hypothetical protein